MRQKILNELVELIEISNKDNINEETYLDVSEQGEGLMMSSIEIISFIVRIEKKYDIIIDLNIYFQTFADIIDYILSMKNNENFEVNNV